MSAIDQVLEWAEEMNTTTNWPGMDLDLVEAAKIELDWLSYKSMLDETIRNRVWEYMKGLNLTGDHADTYSEMLTGLADMAQDLGELKIGLLKYALEHGMEV